MDAKKLSLASLGKLSEEQARSMLERIRWPDGKPVCPHCGVIDDATKMDGESLRDGVYNCRACRKPFSVTVGTVIEGSHIPLSKWMLGFYLFASAKKSMSALQLQRQLDLGSYKSAWHMAHRIRHAMANDPNVAKLAGLLEADEVHVGGRLRNPVKEGEKKSTERRQASQRAWQGKRTPVAVLVSRDGGARARALEKVTAENLRAFLHENADLANSTLHTDEHRGYTEVGREFAGGHHVVNHGKREYARAGGIHSNTAESFNGLFQRSIQGSWHHISREHINRYLHEQCFRWSMRKSSDTDRTLAAIGRIGGARLYYKRPTQSHQGSESLVARR